MLRSIKPTQADEGEFETVFDVDSVKYEMVGYWTSASQLSYWT